MQLPFFRIHIRNPNPRNTALRVAFLIITYTNPQQTLRMIERLRHPDFDFWIHVDLKQPLETHSILFNKPQIYFVENRVDVQWAGFSTVECMLTGCREILRSGHNYTHIHLLSGQCYPIKTTSYIHTFLKINVGREFIAARHFYSEWTEAIPRIEKYHLTALKFPGKYKIQWLLNKLVKRRPCPLPLEFYGKSMFWTLSPDAVRYVLKVFKENPRFRRWATYTWAPDEWIIPTIIMNSPYRHNVVRDNLLYVDMPEGTSHPKTLDSSDFNTLLASAKLFARKMKTEEAPEIFDMLDAVHAKPVTTQGNATDFAI